MTAMKHKPKRWAHRHLNVGNTGINPWFVSFKPNPKQIQGDPRSTHVRQLAQLTGKRVPNQISHCV